MEQYEVGYHKIYGAVLNLPIGESEHQRWAGTLRPLLIQKWKWGEIAMYFILGLPKTPTIEDSIWLVVDRLTKSAHFNPMKVKDPMDKFARLYVHNID